MVWLRRTALPAICCVLLTMATGAPVDEDIVVNCTRRQDINAVKGCCAYPTMNFDGFRKHCGKHMPVGAPRVSPCLYECIFNANNVLTGTEVDPINARSMLERLLGSNQDFLEAYLDGMLNCTDTVEAMIKSRRPRYPNTSECSPVPVFFAVCTQKHVFNHCPSSSWSGTEACEMERMQNLNCPSTRSSRGQRSRTL